MSFKKFLAPVMSCCCVVSSLVSPCKAAGEKKYKRDELYCYRVENYGQGGYCTIVVEKEAGTAMPETCARCQAELDGEGYLVGHKLQEIRTKMRKNVTRDENGSDIPKVTQEIKNVFPCLVCRACSQTNNVKKENQLLHRATHPNGWLYKCPCNGCHAMGSDLYYRFKSETVPNTLWEDCAPYILAYGAGVLGMMAFFGYLIATDDSANQVKSGRRISRQNKYKHAQNVDKTKDDELEYETDDEDESEIYA